jgi:G3E family GTPase
MEFLGVGLNDRFLPPIQISVVDVNNWQKRGEHNELELNQVQVSSLIVLTHIEKTTKERQKWVTDELKKINPLAKITTMDSIDVKLLPELSPLNNKAEKLEHQKAHWSSCSVDLPNLSNETYIYAICKAIPKEILRVKGCTKIEGESNYIYFERNPDGEVFVRPFNGIPITGSKLLTIGPGSEPRILEKVIKYSLNNKK